MKILMIASEMDGIIKTGGLADFAAALPKALMALGHEVRVVLPKYKQAVMPDTVSSPAPTSSKKARSGPEPSRGFGSSEKINANSLYFNLTHTTRYGCLVYHRHLDDIPVRLVEHHDFFNRDGIYDDGNYAYADNPLRYAFLCKAALESCLQEQWIPDIVHCNDWQTALAPYYLKEHYSHHPEFKNTRSLLTIHNGAYQGITDAKWVDALGILPQRFTSELMEEHGLLNLLKCGIMYADGINAVSPGYCKELLIPDKSHNNLWQYLNQKKDRFQGILNGCDYTQWNPLSDPYLPHPFSVENREGKALCKKALQARMGLPELSDVPLMGLISRLVDQKGFEYLIPALEQLLYENPPVQLALLGSGDPAYGSRLHHLQNRYPHKMSFVNGYDNGLAHLIEAGSDFFMMPSLFEPCGLNQLYSLAYGTLPIIRETGGLKDTVVGVNLDLDIPSEALAPPSHAGTKALMNKNEYATGIGFIHPDPQNCYGALKLAMGLYFDHRPLYLQMQQRAMGQLFTWDESARGYSIFYEKLQNT